MPSLSEARKTATRVTSSVCGQALHDGVEQGAEVGLRVEPAAEFDQRLAIVEALLVEDPIDAGLDHALERIEDEAGDDDGGDAGPRRRGWAEPGVDDLGGERDDAEVERRPARRWPGCR